MRRAAIAMREAFIPRGFELAEVVKIPRPGVFFVKIGRSRRSVYEQFDGKLVLADECCCGFDWNPDPEITYRAACPIDQHRVRAIKR
jgi:hypothetical protein